MGILFISHNLRVVNELCSKVLVMKDGKVLERGLAAEIFENPRTDYTKELIAAIPTRTKESRFYELLKAKAVEADFKDMKKKAGEENA